MHVSLQETCGILLVSLREFRRPYFWRPGASDWRGFVKQPSFDNFYERRLTMAPHSPKNGTNLAQKGVPE